MLVKIEVQYLTTDNYTYCSKFTFCCELESMPFFKKEINQAVENTKLFAIGIIDKITGIKIEASIDAETLLPENQGEKKSCEN
jgi:hypothetical protein